MNHPEQDLQRAVVQMLNVVCPVPWWAVPNGGYRNHVEAAILKGQGVKAGVADLLFVLPGGVLGAVEMKTKGTYQSPAQKAWQASVEAAGGHYAVCRSCEDVLAALWDWGVPIKARIAA